MSRVWTLHREEVNDLIENSFVEHLRRKHKIRVHTKPDRPEDDRFTKWVDFDYHFEQSPWAVLNYAGKYEAVILEWLVNVYSKDSTKWGYWG